MISHCRLLWHRHPRWINAIFTQLSACRFRSRLPVCTARTVCERCENRAVVLRASKSALLQLAESHLVIASTPSTCRLGPHYMTCICVIMIIFFQKRLHGEAGRSGVKGSLPRLCWPVGVSWHSNLCFLSNFGFRRDEVHIKGEQ